jgi:hypothetical protein
MANAEQNAYDSYVAERSCCILLVVDKNTVFILPVIQCHSHKARTPRENSSIMESHLKTYKGICAMSTYKGICVMSYDCLPLTSSLATLTMARIGVTPP